VPGHTISGQVRGVNGGLDGIEVDLFDVRQKQNVQLPSETTKNGGKYAFVNVSDGPYRITPAASDRLYDTDPLHVRVNGGDLSGLDFQEVAANPTALGTDADLDELYVKCVLDTYLVSFDKFVKKYGGADPLAGITAVRRQVRALLKGPGDALDFSVEGCGCDDMEEQISSIRTAAEQQISDIGREADRRIEALKQQADKLSAGSKGDAGQSVDGSSAGSGDPPKESVDAVKCTVCQSRYYTPGTMYYMNFGALQTCLNNPPCDPT